MGAETGLAGEKYISFTTFRRDGTPVSSPTWLVRLDDGRLGFWTSSRSGKAKRLAHTARVTLQPSDARGRTKDGSSAVEGSAEIVAGGPVYDEVVTKVRAKYGFMTKITKFLNTLGHLGKDFPYGDVAVVTTLPPGGGAP